MAVRRGQAALVGVGPCLVEGRAPTLEDAVKPATYRKA
ncbi:hypothetical protein FHT17_004089 [Novosphingobium sp. SG916]|nr:hypothetical protein [Novosphingobium sp. SG916]